MLREYRRKASSEGIMRTMSTDALMLPFFDGRHPAVLAEASRWLEQEPHIDELDVEDYAGRSRAFVHSLGRAGLIRHMIPEPADEAANVDVRSICLVREALCYRSALADSAYVMQGIGAAAIWRHGDEALQRRYLPALRDGTVIPAFALSEPGGGSDVSATQTTAVRDGADFVIDGVKTWTSNAGIADVYLVFARTGERPGAHGLSAFLVEADNRGLEVLDRIVVSAPHPMASVRFTGCRVPESARVGEPGEGFRLAMSTLDIYRATVGAAAIGLARRAFDETLARIATRRLFGRLMAEMETIQMRVADMHVDLETAMLTVYRAAWARDQDAGRRVAAEASLAKLYATEAAHRVIDSAVQLFGGQGVTRGCIVEHLFRDIRAFRIYEGASQVQKLILGRHVVRPFLEASAS